MVDCMKRNRQKGKKDCMVRRRKGGTREMKESFDWKEHVRGQCRRSRSVALRGQDPGKSSSPLFGGGGTQPGNCFWGENRASWPPQEVADKAEGAKDCLPVRVEPGKQ